MSKNPAELEKEDAKTLCNSRVKAAKILYKNGCFSEAYYLVGYSIELGIKAVIAKKFRRYVIPDKNFINSIYTHDLKNLLNLSGLFLEFEQDAKNDKDLQTNWNVVSKWNEKSRYEIKSDQEAISLIKAITKPKNGILAWIKQHW